MLSGLLVVGGFKIFTFFKISQVECHYDGSECSAKLSQAVSTLKGQLIFSRLQAPLPGYTTSIKRTFPNLLQVEIKKPIPVAIVRNPEGGRFAITSDGYLLEATQEDDLLPPITDESTLGKSVGDQLDRSLVDFYKELKGAWNSKLEATIVTMTVSKDGTVRMHATEDRVVLLTRSELTSGLHSLQEILESTTIDSSAKEIDVRFSHPVIRDRSN